MIPERAIRAQLDKILGSRTFARSDRQKLLLRTLVEETLAGRAGELKETSVANYVYGRGSDFDPRTDPVVRVEAGRLRTRIDRYYEVEGSTDPILIELPKGGYVPQFVLRAPAGPDPPLSEVVLPAPLPPESPLPSQKSRLPLKRVIAALFALMLIVAAVASLRSPVRPAGQRMSIAVLTFSDLSPQAGIDVSVVARALTEETRLALAQLGWIRLLEPGLGEPAEDGLGRARRLGADVVLAGSVRAVGSRIRISARLLKVLNGAEIWSAVYDHPHEQMEPEAVAGEILRAMRPRLTTALD